MPFLVMAFQINHQDTLKMSDNSVDTYTTSLQLQREKHLFIGGFCLSKLDINVLTASRSLFLHPKENLFFETLLYF